MMEFLNEPILLKHLIVFAVVYVVSSGVFSR